MTIDSLTDDPEREFDQSERERLTRNLLRLTQKINNIERDDEYNLEFVRDLHFELFNGIRNHAGRIRNSDYGEEYLNFGPNRSASANDVPHKLEDHFLEARKLFGQLDNLEKSLQFAEEVVKVAAYIHAELIRIHPFRDGNGRISRLVMNFVLRKYKFPLLTVSIPRQEYIDCLNHYYRTKEIELLCELFIRVYYIQLNEFYG